VWHKIRFTSMDARAYDMGHVRGHVVDRSPLLQ
jgi:hypothetical protein